MVAEQSGTAAMAAGSAQCDGSTTRLGGSREAEGGQAQPQEAAGSAQAQCYGPAQLAGTSEQARPGGSREEQATIGSKANGEVDSNGEGMPGLMGDDEVEAARDEEEEGNEERETEAEWRGAMVGLLRGGPKEGSARAERRPEGSQEEQTMGRSGADGMVVGNEGAEGSEEYDLA